MYSQNREDLYNVLKYYIEEFEEDNEDEKAKENIENFIKNYEKYFEFAPELRYLQIYYRMRTRQGNNRKLEESEIREISKMILCEEEREKKQLDLFLGEIKVEENKDFFEFIYKIASLYYNMEEREKGDECLREIGLKDELEKVEAKEYKGGEEEEKDPHFLFYYFYYFLKNYIDKKVDPKKVKEFLDKKKEIIKSDGYFQAFNKLVEKLSKGKEIGNSDLEESFKILDSAKDDVCLFPETNKNISLKRKLIIYCADKFNLNDNVKIFLKTIDDLKGWNKQSILYYTSYVEFLESCCKVLEEVASTSVNKLGLNEDIDKLKAEITKKKSLRNTKLL